MTCLDRLSASWYVRPAMRLGVVLEAFLDRTLDDTLDLVARGAPQITDLETGVGGFAPTPHCDVQQLLRDPTARRRWTERLEDRGFHLSALNVSGNPLDPDGDTARRHDEDLPNAVRLAALLEVDRVVAMAGCPPAREAIARRTSTPAGGCRTWQASTSASGTTHSSRTGASSRSSRTASTRSWRSASSSIREHACTTSRHSSGSPRGWARSPRTSTRATSSGSTWIRSRSSAPFPASGTPTRRTSCSTRASSR